MAQSTSLNKIDIGYQTGLQSQKINITATDNQITIKRTYSDEELYVVNRISS